MHGHHINSPFWNTGSRKVKPVQSEMKLLFTQEETQELTVDEINSRIVDAFQYDDYAWQKANNIRVKYKKRAEGLHKVLYQCPACNTEYRMASSRSTLRCESCGKAWDMSEYGELSARSGETEFSHIPDWYEWERLNVRREVEGGAYSLKAAVRIESLPNAKRFIVLQDMGELTHNMDGFNLTGVCKNEPFDISWAVSSMHSCHIEYDYMGRGDCVDLNTNDDTFY
jgi:transcription elongation factor Elf1